MHRGVLVILGDPVYIILYIQRHYAPSKFTRYYVLFVNNINVYGAWAIRFSRSAYSL